MDTAVRKGVAGKEVPRILRTVSHRARIVAGVLARAADKDGVVELSRREIADRAGMQVGDGVEPVHASRMIKELADAGLIDVELVTATAGRGSKNVITVPSSLKAATRHAYAHTGLTPAESWVYEHVAAMDWSPGQEMWPLAAEMAMELGINTWTLRRMLQRLTEQGYLTVEHGRRPYPLAYLTTDKVPERIGAE